MYLKAYCRKLVYVFYHSRAKANLSRRLANSRFRLTQRWAQGFIRFMKNMGSDAPGSLHSRITAESRHIDSLLPSLSPATRIGTDSNLKLPRISIVTPNYNQGRFLEGCLQSVLSQQYPNVELIVMDGGSNDESVDIIRKYADKITFWESKKDNGQADAINRGLHHATGEVFNWLNSDDRLAPGALLRCAEAFNASPGAAGWIGGCVRTNEEGEIADIIYPNGAEREHIGENWNGRQFYQPSCFLSTKKVREIGGLNPDLYISLDLDLWIRILTQGEFSIGKGIWSVAINHDAAKTQKSMDRMYDETASLQRRYGFERGASNRAECSHGAPFKYTPAPSLEQGLAEAESKPGRIDRVPLADRKHLCFVGDFNRSEDVDALRFFLEEIFPYILCRNWIEFHVIGKAARKCGKQFRSHDVRYLEDITPNPELLEKYKLFVCPMPGNGGMPGKIALAASAGLPIVTTSFGTEGLALQDGQDCFVADSAIEFGEKCNQILQDDICWHYFSRRSALLSAESSVPECGKMGP
jgi:hypothetical protein